MKISEKFIADEESFNAIDIPFKQCVKLGKAGSGKSTLIQEIVQKGQISLEEDSIQSS